MKLRRFYFRLLGGRLKIDLNRTADLKDAERACLVIQLIRLHKFMSRLSNNSTASTRLLLCLLLAKARLDFQKKFR